MERQKVLAAVSLLFLLTAFGLIIGAFQTENWVHTRDDDLEFGLFQVTSNEKGAVGWSWSWLQYTWEKADSYEYFETWYLIGNIVQTYEYVCHVSTLMHQAGQWYFISNIVGFIFLSIAIIGQLSLLINRDPGPKAFQAICVVLFLILNALGGGMWWKLSEDARSNNKQSEEETQFSIRKGDGVYTAIAAFIVWLLSSILCFISIYLSTPVIQYPQQIEYEYGSCWQERQKYAIWLLINILIIVYGIFNLVHNDWIRFGVTGVTVDNKDAHGNLFTLRKWQASDITYHHLAYDWLSIFTCKDDNISQYSSSESEENWMCLTFEPIFTSGKVFMYLELGVLWLLTMHVVVLAILVIWNRDFGEKWFNLMTPVIAFCLQVIAIVVWANISGVDTWEEDDECANKNFDGDKLDIWCAGGPWHAMLQAFFQSTMLSAFSPSYISRHSIYENLQDPKIGENRELDEMREDSAEQEVKL